jgi:hypothetical protein
VPPGTLGGRSQRSYSIPPITDTLRKLAKLEPWIVLDNDGSFQGHFNFVPLYLRKGPWFVLAPYYLALFGFLVAYFKPASFDFPVRLSALNSFWHYFDCACALNGIVVLVLILRQIGPAPLVTYTMISWSILTVHNVLSASLPYLPGLVPLLGPLREFLRFPALVAATITFVIWNAVLAPIFYFKFMKTAAAKAGFLTWILSPIMFEIHVFNYPIAVLSTLGDDSTRRPLEYPDLWCALAVAFCYSLFYLLVLDRLGVHLYPVFSPRTKLCIVFWSAIFVLYYVTFRFWNAAIEEARIYEGGGITTQILVRVLAKTGGFHHDAGSIV